MPLEMRLESGLCWEHLNNRNNKDAVREAGLCAAGHHLPSAILCLQRVGGLQLPPVGCHAHDFFCTVSNCCTSSFKHITYSLVGDR